MGKLQLIFASIGLSLCSALLGFLPAHAADETDDAGRACYGPLSIPDVTIAGCSAVIESGNASGRQLATAYSQRGYARTLKRVLPEAEKDLDEAIRIAPDDAQPISTGPISGP
jgi:hypothetical protein